MASAPGVNLAAAAGRRHVAAPRGAWMLARAYRQTTAQPVVLGCVDHLAQAAAGIPPPGNADPGLGVRQVGRSTGQATWRSGGSACSAILRDGLPPDPCPDAAPGVCAATYVDPGRAKDSITPGPM
jgi:hypothetical protein